MELYLHDHVATFRFVLRGELNASSARELEHAWQTASSVTAHKAVVVDVTALTRADSAGMDLLARMRRSGAVLTASASAAQSAAQEELLCSLGVVPARLESRRVLRLAGWRQTLLRLLSAYRWPSSNPERVPARSTNP